MDKPEHSGDIPAEFLAEKSLVDLQQIKAPHFDKSELYEWRSANDPIPANKNEWDVVSEDLNFPVVYFAYNQDRIGESGRTKLNQIVTYMKQQQSVGIIIEGHSDERGSNEFNRALSQRRAIAVKDYLISMGISKARFRTLGFGEERPAVSGDSVASMAKNRRAELVPARIP